MKFKCTSEPNDWVGGRLPLRNPIIPPWASAAFQVAGKEENTAEVCGSDGERQERRLGLGFGDSAQAGGGRAALQPGFDLHSTWFCAAEPLGMQACRTPQGLKGTCTSIK